MRPLVLIGSFFTLLAALCALWAFRFERVPGLPTWRLAEVKAAAPVIPGLEWAGPADEPRLLLRVNAGDPPVAARLAIPGAPAVSGLHLRFRMTARGLLPGAETWSDGRIMIEWHRADEIANDPVGSIQHDMTGATEDFVVLTRLGPAVPALRLEHLGRAGEFEIADLEITPIRERTIWKIGKWLLALGWLVWGVAWIRSWPGISWVRALGASMICLLMGIHFVIPGPWKIQRALHSTFELGAEPTAPAAVQSTSTIKSGALPALGKVPVQGGFALRVKLRIVEARPLLHVLLLFFPALLMTGLVGRAPTLILMLAMALAIEAAQSAFGYGFDRTDVLDLLCNATGILLALWLFPKIKRLWTARVAAG